MTSSLGQDLGYGQDNCFELPRSQLFRRVTEHGHLGDTKWVQ